MTIKDLDAFWSGKKRQYESLFPFISERAEQIPGYAFKNAKDFSDACLARGGVFWSDRMQILIPGKFKGQTQHALEEFQNKLKQQFQ